MFIYRWMISSSWCEQSWTLNCLATTVDEAIAFFFDAHPDADDYAVSVVCVDAAPHMESFWQGESAQHLGPYRY
jgi:hypothetical protein